MSRVTERREERKEECTHYIPESKKFKKASVSKPEYSFSQLITKRKNRIEKENK